MIKRRQMGLRKEIGCLFLLLLVILHLETSCFADGSSRFARLRGGSSSTSFSNKSPPFKSSSSSKGSSFGRNGDDKDVDDDEDVFGVDKRKIHTGPNPLHNR